MMNEKEEIIRKINELKESDIPEPEKSKRIIKLARELGMMVLENKE